MTPLLSEPKASRHWTHWPFHPTQGHHEHQRPARVTLRGQQGPDIVILRLDWTDSEENQAESRAWSNRAQVRATGRRDAKVSAMFRRSRGSVGVDPGANSEKLSLRVPPGQEQTQMAWLTERGLSVHTAHGSCCISPVRCRVP